MTPWTLRRTRQCRHCPWRRDVNPRDIPNGYSVEKHAALASTIAIPGDVSAIAAETLHVMACHEGHEEHCVGWVWHQLGEGNNIALRVKMLSCTNADRLRVQGPQHTRFEDTLPKEKT